MPYIDTSVIVLALDPTDPRRQHAITILEKEEYKIISELVLAELASVLSRREELISNLASKLGLSRELTIIAILLYILRRFNLRYRVPTIRAKALPFGRIYTPIAIAIELSATIKLKTLDLLHVAYIKLLREEGEPINTLITADTDFKSVEKELRDIVGIKVSLIE
ncbi:MAG: PIN domain nuclease [Thermoprotei archaeon]|nr:MAG: PIN domain nuclease [Thermoprotei archaeon]